MMKKFLEYLKESREELKQVKWPSKELTIKYTKMVIVISLATAVFLGGIDALFNYLITNFI